MLLTPIALERDTKLARAAFAALPADERRCVWTGRRIPSRFEVDHVISFALWQSNELWNRLPAARAVNKQKRDQLPARELLRRRRPAIQDGWAALEEAHPPRFTAELGCLTGADGGTSDLDAGFDALCEAIEITALQRGCKRWAPVS